jgi:glycosyltransferase involved in cell wall biosynthesis
MTKALHGRMATNPTASGDSLASPLDTSWAHVSGWGYRTGRRRTVSCVIPCRNHGSELAALLPMVSDLLTEGGYPWELIALDCGSTDATEGVLSAWTRVAGVRWLQLPPSANMALRFATGLSLARGDAVIFVDPALPHPPALIPSMLMHWEAQAVLVYAIRSELAGKSLLMQWNAKTLQAHREARPDFSLPDGVIDLSLMDRTLVDLLAWRR